MALLASRLSPPSPQCHTLRSCAKPRPLRPTNSQAPESSQQEQAGWRGAGGGLGNAPAKDKVREPLPPVCGSWGEILGGTSPGQEGQLAARVPWQTPKPIPTPRFQRDGAKWRQGQRMPRVNDHCTVRPEVSPGVRDHHRVGSGEGVPSQGPPHSWKEGKPKGAHRSCASESCSQRSHANCRKKPLPALLGLAAHSGADVFLHF